MADERFVDLPYVEQIRRRLWCDREYGQATVMVGAGFCKNAIPVSSISPPFLTWGELGGKMYDELYKGMEGPPISREQAVSGGGVLTLAREFELTFGDQALQDLILDAVPDTEHRPGRLHELLMSLPWSDVFTTNYDTLLERTRPFVHDRKYDLVNTVSDIPGAMQPRIVKLHGSFPSHRPFIITEEHYRRYPSDFAPFVNLVQQAIMENTVCLLGFSGDDPNFLYWTGWVRDNLGPSAPPIYLVGLLDLSPSRRRLLESRNVRPVDLTPLFPRGLGWAEGDRHYRALKWFLITLLKGAPPNPKHWPRTAQPVVVDDITDLPAIPDGHTPLLGPGKVSYHTPLSLQSQDDIMKIWTAHRKGYPGWVFTPFQNRETLWLDTKNWVDPILDALKSCEPPRDLFLCYELFWRLEHCAVPLDHQWVASVCSVLNRYDFAGASQVGSPTVAPSDPSYKDLDWTTIMRQWTEIGFVLARKAREDQDSTEFSLWMERLRSVIKQAPDWADRWHYEMILFSLYRCDIHGVRSALAAWPFPIGRAEWQIKRAAVLAETGDVKAAQEMAEGALTDIRSRIKAGITDFALLSLEGWAMALLKALKSGIGDESRGMVEGSYRDRLEKLAAYRCDPWSEIEHLEAVLEQPIPAASTDEEANDPDIANPTTWFGFRFGRDVSDFRPALAFLRMSEMVGLPLRSGPVGRFSATAVRAAKWLSALSPHWAMALMLRTGSRRELADWFDRPKVESMNSTEVTRLYQILTGAQSQLLEELRGHAGSLGSLGYVVSQLVAVCGLLGSLAVRLSVQQQVSILSSAIDMYRMPSVRDNHNLLECPKILFEAYLDALPDEHILAVMSTLLALPLPGDEERIAFSPDPFRHIEWSITRLPPDFDRTEWAGPIAHLLTEVQHGKVEARTRAVLRLFVLFQIDALTPNELEAFGEALWSRVDPVSGMPSDTGLREFAFLRLPSSHLYSPERQFRAYLAANEIPRGVCRTRNPDGTVTRSISWGGDEGRVLHNWAGAASVFAKRNQQIDLSRQDTEVLLVKTRLWWEEEKPDLSSGDPGGSVQERVRERAYEVVDMLGGVLLPRIVEARTDTQASALQLLSDMRDVGVPVLHALPSVLIVAPERCAEVASSLRSGINSASVATVVSAIKGLARWGELARLDLTPEPPEDLIEDLINRVMARRQPGLGVSIACASDFVKLGRDRLKETHYKSLYLALEYLVGETASLSADSDGTDRTVAAPVPVKHRPRYRKLAARLARSLFDDLSRRNQSIPLSILTWRQLTTVYPEVRRGWGEGLAD